MDFLYQWAVSKSKNRIFLLYMLWLSLMMFYLKGLQCILWSIFLISLRTTDFIFYWSKHINSCHYYTIYSVWKWIFLYGIVCCYFFLFEVWQLFDWFGDSYLIQWHRVKIIIAKLMCLFQFLTHLTCTIRCINENGFVPVFFYITGTCMYTVKMHSDSLCNVTQRSVSFSPFFWLYSIYFSLSYARTHLHSHAHTIFFINLSHSRAVAFLSISIHWWNLKVTRIENL